MRERRNRRGAPFAARVLLSLALLAGLGSGCGESFAPYWRIEKFRLLGIRSTPITAKPDQPAQLEALVHNPDPDAAVTYAWEWCPFQTSFRDEYKCPFTMEELNKLVADGIASGEMGGMGMGGNLDLSLFLPAFDLGTEPTATLPYPAAILSDAQRVEFVQGLCQLATLALAGQGEEVVDSVSASDCRSGYEVSVRLVVESGGERIVSSKRVLWWAGGDELQTNENPDPRAIQIRLADAADAAKVRDKLDWVKPDGTPDDDRWHTLSDAAPTPILTGVAYEIRSELAPESIQLIQKPAPEGSDLDVLPPEKEAFIFRWFTTFGDLGDSRRLYAPELLDDRDASVTSFNISYSNSPDGDWDRDGVKNSSDTCPTIPQDVAGSEDCTVKLWSVVRDGRRGLQWLERSVKLVGHAE